MRLSLFLPYSPIALPVETLDGTRLAGQSNTRILDVINDGANDQVATVALEGILNPEESVFTY